jgi:hypothetical protein
MGALDAGPERAGAAHPDEIGHHADQHGHAGPVGGEPERAGEVMAVAVEVGQRNVGQLEQPEQIAVDADAGREGRCDHHRQCDQQADELLVHHGLDQHGQHAEHQRRQSGHKQHLDQIEAEIDVGDAVRQLERDAGGHDRGQQQEQHERHGDQLGEEEHGGRRRRCVDDLGDLDRPLAPQELAAVGDRDQQGHERERHRHDIDHYVGDRQARHRHEIVAHEQRTDRCEHRQREQDEEGPAAQNGPGLIAGADEELVPGAGAAGGQRRPFPHDRGTGGLGELDIG